MKAKLITAIFVSAVISISTMQQAYALDFMWPDDVYQMTEEICKPYQISPELVQAIIWRESRYATDAVNGPCKGLMQININCHQERMEKLGVTDLNNPYENIQVGVDYLHELYQEYEETSYVLDVYSGNSSAESNFNRGKMSCYAKSICELSEELEIEHGK